MQQGGLWTEKGMVSRQQEERGEKKELAGKESLGAWEAGIPQVGNWQCPPSQQEWIGSGEGGESGNRDWEGGPGRIYTLVGL